MKIAIYSFLVGTGALLLTIVMIVTTVTITGDTYQPTMFINSVLGCYGIGSGVTYYILRQSEKLKKAIVELDLAHSKLEAAHAETLKTSRIDQMTGLLNRTTFFNDIYAKRSSTGVNSIMIIDADNFHTINTRWGHHTGDKALLMIANTIKQTARETDLVGRIGGEEFAIFLPGANRPETVRIAEKIRKAVKQLEFHPNGTAQSHILTVSIGGIAMITDTDISAPLREADQNLYKAKTSGRNMSIIGNDLSVAA